MPGEHKVDINKGADGWLAVTRIELPESRGLLIETRKHTVRGRALGVVATATVFKFEGGSRQHAFSMVNDGSGDFRKELIVNMAGKATEANVRALHAAALSKSAEVLAEVTAWYAAQVAKKAEQEAQKATRIATS